MELKTCSRREAMHTPPNAHWAVISIYTPEDVPATLQHGWGIVSFFAIPDTDTPIPDMQLTRLRKAIIRAMMGGYKGVIIHCDMGVSRSVGIAKAISDTYKIDYSSPFSGNASIYRSVFNSLNTLATTQRDYEQIF